MTLAIFLITLFGAIVLGIPIAFSLLASGVVLMFYLDTFNTQIIAQNLIMGANSFPLLAIPFFILAGEIMNAGGLSTRIVKFAMAMLGHVRGGLGYVAILASVLFAGLSGSAIADTAALGALLIPMMVKGGYDIKRSTGLIASGGIIAGMIPPSIAMIMFGVISGVSVSRLFMAGIVPGLLMAIGLAVVWAILVRKEKIEVLPRKSLKEILIAGYQASWALLLPVIILVGLRGGIFTPTEAGAVAVFYALFVGIFIYREIKLTDLFHILVQASKVTSIVVFLVAAAIVVAWLITIANLPADLANLLGPLVDNPIMLLIVINVVILLLGMIMDTGPIMLILVPVLLPITNAAGIDPLYLGILFILNGSIGLLTPPVGSVLNVAAGVAKIPVTDVVKGIWPFILVYLLILILLLFFPQIVLYPADWLMK